MTPFMSREFQILFKFDIYAKDKKHNTCTRVLPKYPSRNTYKNKTELIHNIKTPHLSKKTVGPTGKTS